MRRWTGKRLEGRGVPGEAMSFPYLAQAEQCDGCMDCVQQCPICAVEIERLSEARAGAATV
jgi:ferredoxin